MFDSREYWVEIPVLVYMPRCDVIAGRQAHGESVLRSKQILLAIILHTLRTLGATTAAVTQSSTFAAILDLSFTKSFGHEDSESLPCTHDPSRRIC